MYALMVVWRLPGPRPVGLSDDVCELDMLYLNVAAYIGDLVAYGDIFWRGRRQGAACVRRERFFLRVNLLWWRWPKLRHGGPCMSAPGVCGNLTAHCGVLSSAAYTGGVRNIWTLCGGGRC